jgi:hypothetical protein
MKSIFTLLLITLSSFSIFSQSKQNSFPESGFNASFPESLKVEKNDLDSQYGKINMTLYLAEGEDYMIMLSESKYPQEFLKALDKSGTKGMLAGAKNGALNNMAQQMQSKYVEKTSEDFLFNDKYDGNKFSGNINEVEIVGKTFMKNNQMYQMLVMGNTTSKDAVTFLNSFKLIE